MRRLDSRAQFGGVGSFRQKKRKKKEVGACEIGLPAPGRPMKRLKERLAVRKEKKKKSSMNKQEDSTEMPFPS